MNKVDIDTVDTIMQAQWNAKWKPLEIVGNAGAMSFRGHARPDTQRQV